MKQSNWIETRRLLWDDDEHVLIVDDVRQTKPMKQAGKITVQPKAQYCCGNSFRPSSTRRKDNVAQFHTWCIEFDEMAIDQQRELWAQSDMPFTLLVFSGNKSLHCYIRTAESVDAETWQQIANALKRIYPEADTRVLTDCARLTRLPEGLRGDVCQKVETTKERIPLQSLTEWIEAHDVTKRQRDKETKGLRDKDTKKNIFEPPPSSEISERIRAMAKAVETFADSHPAQHRLYTRLVQDRFTAERGKRNERLIELVTFLHDATCKAVAMRFAEWFYNFNVVAFNDPPEQHMREALAHWMLLDAQYPSRLGSYELEVYRAIPEREQSFFRICRSLAHREGADMKLNIPMHHIGLRMELDGKQVSRLINRFKQYGLIELVQRGTAHKPSEDGKIEEGAPSLYRWNPESVQ